MATEPEAAVGGGQSIEEAPSGVSGAGSEAALPPADYSLDDAYNDAVKALSDGGENGPEKEASKEQETGSTEDRKEEGPPESTGAKEPEKNIVPGSAGEKKPEVSPVREYTPEEKVAIDHYKLFMSNSDYQRQVAESIIKSHGLQVVNPAEKKAEPSSPSPEIQEAIDGLDPEIRQVLEHIADQKIKPHLDRVQNFIKSQEEQIQRAGQEKIQRELNEFVTENKDDYQKYQGKLINFLQDHPTFFSKGKAGMKQALDFIAGPDRVQAKIEAAVQDAVAKALERSNAVAGNVKRFSAAQSQKGESFSPSGTDFEDLAACYQDAVKKHGGLI